MHLVRRNWHVGESALVRTMDASGKDVRALIAHLLPKTSPHFNVHNPPPDPCHSNEKPGCQHSTPPNLCKSGMIQVLEVLVSYR